MNRLDCTPGQNKTHFNCKCCNSAGCRQERNFKILREGVYKIMNKDSNTNNKDFEKRYRSKLYKEIKKDLLDQNERNGTVGKYYTDLIEDYMDMWVTKCLLIEDIKSRGVNSEYNNGGGQKGIKKNESIDQLIKLNGQMLKLLTEIGIKPSQQDVNFDDIEEM